MISPSLHVIRFQEHWAHKPGHVLLCPVCQNNSAVSNTVRLRFHFSLPRYCRTLQRVTFPMSTSLQFVKMRASVLEPLTSDESNSRRWGGPSTRMILWNLWPFVTVCRESLWITASWKPRCTRKQRPKEEMLSGSKGSSVDRGDVRSTKALCRFSYPHFHCEFCSLFCHSRFVTMIFRWFTKNMHTNSWLPVRKMMVMLMMTKRRWRRSGRRMTKMCEVMVWLYAWCVAWLLNNITTLSCM